MSQRNGVNHEESLGPELPNGEFSVNNSRVITCLVLASLILLVSVAIIAVGLMYAFPEPVLNKRILAVLLGTVGVVISLLLFVLNWKKYGQRVVVYSEGFCFRNGRQSLPVRWDDIAAVWRHSSTVGTSKPLAETHLWIQMKSGEKIYLNSFFLGMEKLAQVVLAETAQRMIPAMQRQLEQGQPVLFGNVEISTTELVASGRSLTWNNVAVMNVAHGAINIQANDGKSSWYYTQIKSLPNYHVFLALAEKLIKPVESETH